MRLAARFTAPLLAGLFACQLAGRKSVGEVLLQIDLPDRGPRFSSALYQAVGVSLTPGNAVEWMHNGAVFQAMAADIAGARNSVNVVTFIWADGKCSKTLLAELGEATQRGVKCRVLVDAVGSFTLNDEPLKMAGCEVRRFRPVPGQDDLARDHRKLVIVDGGLGYAGGFGIDDKWLGHGKKDDEWRDSNARMSGPAVRQMQQAFAENWLEAGGSLLPLTDFPKLEDAGKVQAAVVTSSGANVVTKADRLMQLLIAAAHKRLWISNAYFVPSEPIIDLLGKKALDGVDVRILMAGEKTDTRVYLPDQRARVARLLPSGVRAFEYAPSMMHAKTVLVDDDVVSVGSLNLDALSLNKMEEVTLVAQDRTLAQQLAEAFTDDMTRSLEVKLPKDPKQRVQ